MVAGGGPARKHETPLRTGRNGVFAVCRYDWSPLGERHIAAPAERYSAMAKLVAAQGTLPHRLFNSSAPGGVPVPAAALNSGAAAAPAASSPAPDHCSELGERSHSSAGSRLPADPSAAPRSSRRAGSRRPIRPRSRPAGHPGRRWPPGSRPRARRGPDDRFRPGSRRARHSRRGPGSQARPDIPRSPGSRSPARGPLLITRR